MNNKHMFFFFGLMSHAGVMISSFKKVHNGTTEHQKLKNERPHRNILFFEEKVACMIFQDNNHKKKFEQFHQHGDQYELFTDFSVRQKMGRSVRVPNAGSAVECSGERSRREQKMVRFQKL